MIADKFGDSIYKLVNKLKSIPKYSNLKKVQTFVIKIITNESKIPKNKLKGY